MHEDPQLLHRYVKEGAQDAFAELVRRHVDFVYAAALRQLGNGHRAEEVTQVVFTDLARKAGQLRSRPDLLGWLYLSTRYAALRLKRGEARRGEREKEAHMIATTLEEGGEPHWENLAPVLDAALGELGEADRDALLLRFFKDRTFADVGQVLGVTEEAAKKRVHRALEKLRPILARKGVTSTASGLAFALTNQSAVAAPAELAATVTASALQVAAAGTVGAGLLAGWWQGIGAGKVAAVALILVTAGGYFLSRKSAVPEQFTPVSTGTVSAPASAGSQTGIAVAPAIAPAAGAVALPATPAPTLSEILAEPDSLRALALYSRHLLTLAPAEFAAVFGRLVEISKPEQRNEFMSLLLQRWGQVDPLGGFATLTVLKDRTLNGNRVVGMTELLGYKNTLIEGWATKQPEEALDWVLKNFSDLDQAVALQLPGQLAIRAQLNLPREGIADALRRDLLEGRQIGMINELVAYGQFRAAADLLSRAVLAQDSALGLESAKSLMGAWAVTDGEAASVWLRDHLAPGKLRRAAVTGFIQCVAAQDLEIATRYVQASVARDEIEASSTGVLAHFNSHNDGPGARRWLESQMGENPQGGFDEAIAGYLGMMAAPGAALVGEDASGAMLARIRDPQARRRIAGQYAVTLIDRAPVSAVSAYLQAFSETERWTDTALDYTKHYTPRQLLTPSTSLPALMTRWARRDLESASAFVRQSPGLTVEERTKLTAILAQSPKSP